MFQVSAIQTFKFLYKNLITSFCNEMDWAIFIHAMHILVAIVFKAWSWNLYACDIVSHTCSYFIQDPSSVTHCKKNDNSLN